jgi:hypothetical protein
MRDGVLADLERFTGAAPREDDQTVRVLEIPWQEPGFASRTTARCNAPKAVLGSR